MILLLLFVLSPSHLCAIIIEGISFECGVKMIADRHPSAEHRPDQSKLKNQLVVLDAFLQNKSPQNTVVLAEEISPSIAKYIKPNDACILRDMRILANRHGLPYENIDLRGATLAAGNVIKRYAKNGQINPSLSFGPTEDSLKRPVFVILDDLFGEKELYIDRIKERFSWSDDEQKQSDRLSQALLNTLQGWDFDTTVRTFCSQTSPLIQQKVYDQMGKMSMHVFDNYAKKTVMDYNSRDHTILFAAGYQHVQNIKNQLAADHGWDDYRIYSNGDVLTDYNLKSTLGTATWWDNTKNYLGYTS